MSVSTKLFADQMLNRFSRINDEIELRQTKISTGQEITQASDKPIDAVRLSALEERSTQLAGFVRNVRTAQESLTLADAELTSAFDMLTRLREIGTAANSDTIAPIDREAFRVEVAQIRTALVGLANSRTTDGQAIFAGYATDTTPFALNASGGIDFKGDGGEHTLAASETMRLPTSVNGGRVFMQVETNSGMASIFDIVDSFEAALSTKEFVRDSLSVPGDPGLSLQFNGDRVPRDVSFVIEGPSGRTAVNVSEVVGGSNDRLIEAINAQSVATGITAELSENGRLQLSAGTGTVTISELDVEGVNRASKDPKFTFTTDGVPAQTLAPVAQQLGSQLTKLIDAGQHIALSRTTVGARLERAESQEENLLTRSVALDTQLNDLSAADLERVITELQSLLVNRDAARQAYSKISQSSLFDFLN
ncbi:flagellar hook-associated protein FlgL [Lacimonas salitolerans]|uniref:Flagellar hook-associated protein FlgL n=1 Tax=Lacimonas salitolerans TaxID=1323750 RepID=A0ABW4EIM0_9RHOB